MRSIHDFPHILIHRTPVDMRKSIIRFYESSPYSYEDIVFRQEWLCLMAKAS